MCARYSALGEITMWKRPRTWVTLTLLVVCNVVAWDVVTFLDEMVVGIPFYKSIDSYGNTQYTGIVPGIRVFGRTTSYALSFLVGIVLPFVAPWLWWRKRKNQKTGSTETAGGSGRKLPTGQSVLASFALLIGLNVLAWDWINTDDKASLYIVATQEHRTYSEGFIRLEGMQYTGIAPGICFQDRGVSIAASFFVGEILPFLLAPMLFRRRQPVVLPQRPVAGAPR